jgi:hypothetical protein
MKMVGRPARVTQREIQTVIRGARKEGVASVEIRIGKEAVVIIPLGEDEKKLVADEEGIVL